MVKDRARDALERASYRPIPVVSCGGWIFASTNTHTSTDSPAAAKSGDLLLAPGALPPQCKVNGTPAMLLEYDRESCIFETQGVGRGWPPGVILELQPLFRDGAPADALNVQVEEIIWELEAMGLVRAERQGCGSGEPILFAEHPTLLAEL